MERQFYKMYCDIARCGTIVSMDGVEHSFTASDKIVYFAMKSRFDFFTSLGKQYYDGIDDIADLSGQLHRSTVAAILKKLIDCGVVFGEIRRNSKGNKKWFFSAVNEIECKETLAFVPERVLESCKANKVDYTKAPPVKPFTSGGDIKPEMQEWLSRTSGATLQALLAYRKTNPLNLGV
jgi:predicted transcriptional regulator